MYTLLIFNPSPISVRMLLRLLTRRGPCRPGERSQVGSLARPRPPQPPSRLTENKRSQVGSLARPRPPQPRKRVLDREVLVVPRGKGWKRGCFPQRGRSEGPCPPPLALSQWCHSLPPSPNGPPPPSTW